MNLSESEKRLEPRVQIPAIPVYALSEDDMFFYGYAKNISRSGMLLLSYLECEVGQEYTLEFALPVKPKLFSRIFSIPEEISISCRSNIIWCKESAMGIHGPVEHGLKFIDAALGAGKDIESWVTSQLRN
ncbi:MAG: PilZ domain-containing protein [Nitrospirota bacterium]